eukprot:3518705-Pleurochrysis_carterae.AAC.1
MCARACACACACACASASPRVCAPLLFSCRCVCTRSRACVHRRAALPRTQEKAAESRRSRAVESAGLGGRGSCSTCAHAHGCLGVHICAREPMLKECLCTRAPRALRRRTHQALRRRSLVEGLLLGIVPQRPNDFAPPPPGLDRVVIPQARAHAQKA